MKKKIAIISSILGLVILTFLYINYNNSKKITDISIESSDVVLQDVSIDLVQKQGNKITNLTTFDKNELNSNKNRRKTSDITVDSDGNIILQAKINEKHYETILIPYVTQGNSIYSIDIQIIENEDSLFVIGEYDTLLEDHAEINSKLELKE